MNINVLAAGLIPSKKKYSTQTTQSSVYLDWLVTYYSMSCENVPSFDYELSRSRKITHFFVRLNGVLLGQFLQLDEGIVGVGLQLFLELQSVLVHLRFQFVLQSDELLLVLSSHALVSRHLLSELIFLLVLMDLTCHLDGQKGD